jgi:hypothetical protein
MFHTGPRVKGDNLVTLQVRFGGCVRFDTPVSTRNGGGEVYSRYAHYQRKPDGSHFVEFVTEKCRPGKRKFPYGNLMKKNLLELLINPPS